MLHCPLGFLPPLFLLFDMYHHHRRQDAAGQNTRSSNTFASIGGMSPTLWVARGYAVLDGPTLPIVAEVLLHDIAHHASACIQIVSMLQTRCDYLIHFICNYLP